MYSIVRQQLCLKKELPKEWIWYEAYCIKKTHTATVTVISWDESLVSCIDFILDFVPGSPAMILRKNEYFILWCQDLKSLLLYLIWPDLMAKIDFAGQGPSFSCRLLQYIYELYFENKKYLVNSAYRIRSEWIDFQKIVVDCFHWIRGANCWGLLGIFMNYVIKRL